MLHCNKMAEKLEVFVLEPYEVDWFAFSLWLQGCSEEVATEKRREREERELANFRDFPDYDALLRSETKNDYRVFRALEVHLHNPPSLFAQSLFRLPETSKEELVRLYYSFDACVVRDFLGKKLSAKNRRDLDDTSEQTGISLKSCRRQFDNIKRILKVVDDLDGSLVENICEQFHLPESMARQYAALVFVSHTRFDTMKRRAQQLPLEDILFCAMEMIDHWTVGAEGSRTRATDDDLELDRDFLQQLHDLKLKLIDKAWVERRQKAVMKDLKRQLPPAKYRAVDSHFKVLSRAFVDHGTSLIHSKDLKDFFVDLLENIVDVMQKDLHLTCDEVDTLLDSLISTFGEVEVAHKKPGSINPWQPVYRRYMEVLKKCILQIYHD